jgi:Holliday junction resolvasome RuvABC endonuclease subunit
MNQKLYDKLSAVNGKTPKSDLLGVLGEIREEFRGIYEENTGKCKMVSLDTASTKSGWAYFEAGELVCLGEIDCSKEKDSEIRVENMVMELFKILDKYSPDIVVAEKNVVGRNAKTERMLGHIVGCIKGWTLANFKEFSMLSPSEWRKAVKPVNGAACPRERKEAKAWAVARAGQLHNITVSDNEADAVLLGDALVMRFN